MRELLTLTLTCNLLLFLLSCSNVVEDSLQELQTPSSLSDVKNSPYYISQTEAIEIAKQTIAIQTGDIKAANRGVKNCNTISINSKKTRSSQNDLNLHVINFENNSGFAIVSTDSRFDPIYAYSDTGYIEINEKLMQSGFGTYLSALAENYHDEVAQADTRSSHPPFIPQPEIPNDTAIYNYAYVYYRDDYYYCKRVLTNQVDVQPLVNTKWHILPPYNSKLPAPSNPDQTEAALYEDDLNHRCTPGNDVIAAAQLMTYYGYPQTLGGQMFSWNQLATQVEIEDDNSAGYNMVTDLVRCTSDLYNSSYINYFPPSISNNSFRNWLHTLGYTDSGFTTSYSNISSSLQNGRLVIGMGKRVWPNGAVSDDYVRWLIDGIKTWTYNVYYHRMTPPYELAYRDQETEYFYHCNWGYGQNATGYYNYRFNVGYGFSHTNFQALYFIKPSNQ